MDTSTTDKRTEAHTQGPCEMTYKLNWTSVGMKREGQYEVDSKQCITLGRPSELPPAPRWCPLGRRDGGNGRETFRQNRFQLPLFPHPPSLSENGISKARREQLQAIKGLQCFVRRWRYSQHPSVPQDTCAHTHPHIRLFTICLSLGLSLFMTVSYLGHNLARHRGCHIDLDGWIDACMHAWKNE